MKFGFESTGYLQSEQRQNDSSRIAEIYEAAKRKTKEE